MKHVFYFTILFLFSINLFGQDAEARIDSCANVFVKKLNAHGITQTVCITHWCFGSSIPVDPSKKYKYQNCEKQNDLAHYDLYLFWKQNDSLFIKKFDNCGSFDLLMIKDTSFFGFYKREKNKIDSEDQRKFLAGKDTSSISVGPTDGCYSKFAINNIGTVLTKYYQSYNLEKTKGMAIYQWDEIAKTILDSLEKRNKFQRE